MRLHPTARSARTGRPNLQSPQDHRSSRLNRRQSPGGQRSPGARNWRGIRCRIACGRVGRRNRCVAGFSGGPIGKFGAAHDGLMTRPCWFRNSSPPGSSVSPVMLSQPQWSNRSRTSSFFWGAESLCHPSWGFKRVSNAVPSRPEPRAVHWAAVWPDESMICPIVGGPMSPPRPFAV
jgi:hypothetical protein